MFLITSKICTFKSETYLEPSRTSTMELFCENSQRLKAVKDFRKKPPLYIFNCILKVPLQIPFHLKRKRELEATINTPSKDKATGNSYLIIGRICYVSATGSLKNIHHITLPAY